MKKQLPLKIGLIYFVIILAVMTFVGAFSIPGLVKNNDLFSILENEREREKILFDSMPAKDLWPLPNMFLNHMLDRHYFPSESFYINKNHQILPGSSNSIDPSAYADHLAMLQAACEAQNKDFLYVLCPGKPVEDQDLRQYGIACYRNENSDVLLTALGERNVPYLDLRSALKDLSGEDHYHWFYKSDHHWTADAGVEAARRIVEELNASFNCGLDEEAIKKEKMTRTVFQEPWIGEMGRKILGPWSPKDHLVVWEPDNTAHFRLENSVSGKETDGGFEIFYHKQFLDNGLSLGGKTPYYYLMGGNDTLVKIENRDLKKGNLLIVKDSFSNVVVPYLSLTCASVTTWDMRENQMILSYLQEHPEIETVVVMYTTAFSVKSNMNDFK